MLLKELFSVRGNESSTLLSLYGTLQVVMHFLISWHSDALYYNIYSTIFIIWKCVPSLFKGLLWYGNLKGWAGLILSDREKQRTNKNKTNPVKEVD